MMMTKDQSLEKSPSVRYLTSTLDGLVEYKTLCKQISKSAKKISTLEAQLAAERATFSSFLSQMRTLDMDDSKVAVAAEAFSDLNKRLSSLESILASRFSSHFAEPMLHLVSDLEEILPSIGPVKKQVDDAHHDYTSTLAKLLQATKQKIVTDQKKLKDTEVEVQQKKKVLDANANELNTRLKVAQNKKQRGQWALLAAMRAQREQIASSADRAAALQQHMDNLEISLRTTDRHKWGTHVASIIYSELALLTADHASDADSTMLDAGLAALETPVTLGPFPDFDPMLQLLADPSQTLLNALYLTAGDEAEQSLRSAVRILDAHRKILPLIKHCIVVEVKATENPGTLFRQNTTATRIMTTYTKLTGTPYLNRILKPFIVDVVNSNAQQYEVDPNKVSGESVDQNLSRLVETAQKILDAILRSANEFPIQLRILASFLGQEVHKKFPNNKHASVGGFLFLRFLCPAMLSPGAYGLLDTTANDASRPLVLISKLIQNVSNGVEFGGKEGFMIGANTFITNNIERVKVFFDTLTNLPPQVLSSHPSVATLDDATNHDLHYTHDILVKNLPKITKSLAQYRQKDFIPRLWSVLAELGDPSGYK
jgi:predicted  nucleic acid-binding Zn-ribbon protein